MFTPANDIKGSLNRKVMTDLPSWPAAIRRLLEDGSDLIATTDREGTFTYVSPSYERRMGYHPSEIIGRPLNQFVHPDDAGPVLDSIGQLIKTGQEILTHPWRMRHQSGHWEWLETSATLIRETDDQKLEVAGISRIITERKRAEQALKESEARFRHLSENANDLISIHAIDGMPIFVSPSYERLMGYRLEELSDRSFLDFIHPEDIQAVISKTKSLVKSGEKFASHICRMRHKSGHWEWLETSVTFERDSTTGTILNLITTNRIITGRKRAEEELVLLTLHISEEVVLKQAVMDTVIDGIITIDARGIIETFNRSAERIFGYEAKEVIGKNISLLMPEPHQSAHDGYLKHHNGAGGKIVIGIGREVQAMRKDGRIFPIEIGINSFDSAGQKLFVGSVRDISERKRAEQELKEAEESEKKYRHLSENANDIICNFTFDATFAYVSPSVKRQLGYQVDELIGHNAAEFVHEDDQMHFSQSLSEAVNGDAIFMTATFRVRHKSGHWEWLEAAFSIEKDGATGAILNMPTVCRLVTERVRHEQELQQALMQATMADRAKSNFLAHMSHEIRTPLNAILGFSEIMRDQLFGPLGSARYLDYASDVYNSGDHLLSLVNEMLDLSKIEAGKFDLNEGRHRLDTIMEAACRLLRGRAEQKQLHLDVRLNVNPVLWCDQRILKQVMLNIIGNAVKFTPERGLITIESGLNAVGDLVLTVTDTGIGIAPDDIDTVMKPFGQARSSADLAAAEPGTGLGLPLAKSFIEMHGGTLGLASEYGAGTRITIILPASRVEEDEDHSGVLSVVF